MGCGRAAAAAGERCRLLSSTGRRCCRAWPRRSSRPRDVGVARRPVLHAGSAALATRALLTLRELLASAAQRVDVRVLAWAGAPLPLFHPDRKEVRAMRDELERGTRVRVALDSRERPMHCHHEKLVVIDSEVAFVGGIDLTTYAGDRLDSSEHPAARLDRLARRRRAHPGPGGRRRRRPLPAPMGGGDRRARCPQRRHRRPPGEVELQVVRTVPERIYERLPQRRVRDPRVLPARPACRAAADLPREPVPLVARDRRRARRQAAASARRPLPARRAASGEAEQRQRRHARAARAPGRGRRRRRPLPRLRRSTSRGRRTAGVRPREDRDRRRRVADARLGQPQRALALQRHGDEHRHARPRAREGAPAAPLERAPRAADRPSSTGIPPRSSTSSGARSPRSSSPDGPAASR